jgi:uncharacterized protein (DUF427 family)
MTDDRPHFEPGPDHPITLDTLDGRVLIRRGSVVVADTERALEMHEAAYPAVYYIPLDDVADELLAQSEEHTYCPYKGEASYFDVSLPGEAVLPASVWYYAEPFPGVAAIEGHVAFYDDRFAIETIPSKR